VAFIEAGRRGVEPQSNKTVAFVYVAKMGPEKKAAAAAAAVTFG
jgi:hypothetical protein